MTSHYRYISRDIQTDTHTHTEYTYCIAGNIGGELNLMDWWFWKQIAKLKSAKDSLRCFIATMHLRCFVATMHATKIFLGTWLTMMDSPSLQQCTDLYSSQVPFANQCFSNGRGPKVLRDMVSSDSAVYSIHLHGSRVHTRWFDW